MLNLNAILARASQLHTIATDDRKKIEQVRDDIFALVSEVQQLRNKVTIYHTRTMMNAKRGAA